MLPEYYCDICNSVGNTLYCMKPNEIKALPINFHFKCKEHALNIVSKILENSKCNKIILEDLIIGPFIPKLIDPVQELKNPKTIENMRYANSQFMKFAKLFDKSIKLGKQKIIFMMHLSTWKCLYP